MAYPDWVLKHKKKGTYVNCVKDRYYLYAAHSERIPGTKKVKRICDGYLGRITEEEGFISVKDKVSTDILVYEFGFSCFMLEFCKEELAVPGGEGNLIGVAMLLAILYGEYNDRTFSRSYMSVLFPDIDFTKPPDQVVSTQISKGIDRIRGCLDKLSVEDQAVVFNELPYVYKIKLNDRWYPSKLKDIVRIFIEKYHLTGRF
jgi:hypothetical protein